MPENATNETVSAGRLVDTLFGPRAEDGRTARQRAAADEELPDYLFNVPDDASQAGLPLIRVAHYRPKTIVQEDVAGLIPYLDELALFERRWGFVKQAGDRESWCARMDAEAVPVLERLTGLCRERRLLHPRALYAYFYAAAQDETLYLYRENKRDVFLSIDFPRLKNGVCAADKIARADSGVFDTVAAVAVNMGRSATELAKSWLNAGKDVDCRFLNGFALESAEAMIRLAAARIAREECCLGDVHFLGTAKTGDPAVQSALIKMLNAGAIDIAFSRNYLMMPEYSALALVFPR